MATNTGKKCYYTPFSWTTFHTITKLIIRSKREKSTKELPKNQAVLVQKGTGHLGQRTVGFLGGRGLVMGLTERPDGVFVPQVRPLDRR